MKLNNTVERARELAMRLHAGQHDRNGVPYIKHPEAVAAYVRQRWADATDQELAAAWLHDALEDTDATPESLLAAGIALETVAIVREVTRPAHLTYHQWIAILADQGSRSALRVKLGDNEHNSDPARRLPGSDIVERRYQPARRVLEQALARHDQPAG